MALNEEQIRHLPDLSDRVGDNPGRFEVVEIAEWKSGIGEFLELRYVAGRAVVQGREYLIAGSYRMPDGSIVMNGRTLISLASDYRTIIKL